MTILTPAQVFRKFATDGVPESGKWEPKKDEIVQLLENIQDGTGAKYSVATKADLDAIVPAAGEQPRGEVLDDADASNNGWYAWDSDTSTWVFERPFPDTLASVTLSGTGTAQTGVVDAGVNPAGVVEFRAEAAVENTGPLTLSIGGEEPRPVVNLAGNALSAGEWTGVVKFFIDSNGDYRLSHDAGAAAAAAQSATDAAATLAEFLTHFLGNFTDDSAAAAAAGTPVEGQFYWNTSSKIFRYYDGSAWEAFPYATVADGAVTGAKLAGDAVTEPKLSRSLSARVGALFDTVAELLADTVLTYSNVSAGDIIEAQGFRYEVADSAAVDEHVTTAGGVKLYVLPDKQGRGHIDAFGAVGDDTADDTAPIQAAFDAFDDVVFTNWKTYKITGTINVSRIVATIKGADSTYGVVKIHYYGSGAAFLFSADVVYPHMEGIRLIGIPSDPETDWNTGSIGLDLRQGNTAIHLTRCYIGHFETIAYSAVNSFYNKFIENRFEYSLHGLRNFAVQNLNIVRNRFETVGTVMTVNGNDGQVNVDANVMERCSTIVVSSGSEAASVYFHNNYVEASQGANPILFQGNDYTNLVIRENVFVEPGVWRFVAITNTVVRFIMRDNLFLLNATGNNLQATVTIGSTAQLRHLEVTNALRTIPGDGGYATVYAQSSYSTANDWDFLYFWDVISATHHHPRGQVVTRLTTAQRDAIVSPTPGQLIFNTTTNKLNVRGASAWEEITSA